MRFEALDTKQREVVNTVLQCDTKRILALGGPGTGKTVTALWTARAHLENSNEPPIQRVLFLTFSRSAVSQIVSRLPGILSSYEDRIEIQTFHALAHRLLRAFGRYAGYGRVLPPIQSGASRRLLGNDSGQLQYDDFIPKVLEILEKSDHIRQLLSNRWGLVICDEVQDTSEDQWHLLQILASQRLLLLGDTNQMIYTFLPGVSPRNFNQMRNWVDLEIKLNYQSHRDPTGKIPALAEAIRQRKFDDNAIVKASRNGDLIVHCDTNWEAVPDLLFEVIGSERQKGSQDIGVFAKTNSDVAILARRLNAAGLDCTIAGIGEAHAEALSCMATQCAFAVGLATDKDVRESLGVFLTACKKGRPPSIAYRLVGKIALTKSLEKSIKKRARLLASAVEGNIENLAGVAIQFRESPSWHEATRPWERAAAHFKRLVRPFGQLPVSEESIQQFLETVERNCVEALIDLTYSQRSIVSLMNFHQTKGREFDSVILVFRDNDNFGTATEPFEEESRLLNVTSSRARKRVILILSPTPHPLVKPFIDTSTKLSC